MVHARLPSADASNGVLLGPELPRLDGERVSFNQEQGYLALWGSPVAKYGTIGLALVWNPEAFRGLHEGERDRFVRL
ncbi:MAG: hypothetical protein NT151_06260 [Acidobacteria bacterium]|nr:hypothetical protein [Acidobacteriota bacterium]